MGVIEPILHLFRSLCPLSKCWRNRGQKPYNNTILYVETRGGNHFTQIANTKIWHSNSSYHKVKDNQRNISNNNRKKEGTFSS